MVDKQYALHIIDIILYSLLVDEISQSRRDIQILGSLPVHLFVGEIYNLEIKSAE